VRRLSAVLLLALTFAGAAAAATSSEPLAGEEWWLSHIGADRATPPGQGVPITIVDSGVDATHPEFAGRPNTTYFNDQTVTGREEYHGTIVASIAAAPENGQGILGVYPQAVLQVQDASSGTRGLSDAAAIAGILAAAAHCPGVINLSFGSVTPDSDLEAALLTAVHNGCLVVAASGNSGESGSPTGYPASWPHVFTVGATGQDDEVTSFSTTGAALDLVAPGADMVGAVPLSRDASGYSRDLAGTSFSAPVVAAAAAWVWTLRPDLSAYQLGEVLRHSARDLGMTGFDTSSGWGLLDIPAALALPAPADDPAEPNDDLSEVKPNQLFEAGQRPLTTIAKPAIRISGALDVAEDPRDVYRISIPANRTVHVSVAAGGAASARIWGPQTFSTNEGAKARRRDLHGTAFRAGKTAVSAYVEVRLTGRADRTRYTLSVTAAKR
jgi:hypothetical protein